MTTGKTKKSGASRSEFWNGHVAAQQASGLTVAAYAEQQGLKTASLYHWRGQLARARGTVKASAFVAVQVTPAEARWIELLLPGGTVLRSSHWPAAEWLAAVLRESRP